MNRLRKAMGWWHSQRALAAAVWLRDNHADLDDDTERDFFVAGKIIHEATVGRFTRRADRQHARRPGSQPATIRKGDYTPPFHWG